MGIRLSLLDALAREIYHGLQDHFAELPLPVPPGKPFQFCSPIEWIRDRIMAALTDDVLQVEDDL